MIKIKVPWLLNGVTASGFSFRFVPGRKIYHEILYQQGYLTARQSSSRRLAEKRWVVVSASGLVESDSSPDSCQSTLRRNR